MKRRRPYRKQRVVFYLDENIPQEVIDYLKSSSLWKSKFKFISVAEAGHLKKSDDFHFQFCMKHGYTLVTMDADFDDDRQFPFIGKMSGIVRIRAARGNVTDIVVAFGQFLRFISNVPFPKGFLSHSKFVCSLQGCQMRGRELDHREIRSIYAIAGVTTYDEIIKTFNYYETT